MKQFNNILICGHPEHVDLKLLEHAADIAKYNQSNVKIIHVITDYPKDLSAWWNVRNPGKLRERIIGEREDFLDGLVESLKKLGVENVSRKLLWGKPIDEVSKEMLPQRQDLVMLASKNGGKPSYGNHGNSPMDLLRRCPCPVWVTQTKVTKRVNRIVASIGGDTKHIDTDDTNGKVLVYAAAVAKAENSELHVAHVMPFHDPDERQKDKQARFTYDISAYLGNVRAKIRASCNRLLASQDMSLTDEQIHPLVGRSVLAIPEFLEAKGADLVVIGTAVQKGLQGLLVASTPEKVLKKISCPMLLIKPDGFAERTSRVEESRSTAA